MQQIDNTEIARLFKLYSHLLDLHDGNPFKVKSYANGAFQIDRLGVEINAIPRTDIPMLEGLGKGLSSKIEEILDTGSFGELNELLANTPSGIIDMLGINGIGPKKIKVIWKELGIDNIGELLYACQENRLANTKGFGLKTQETIVKAIAFAQANSSKFHYAKAEAITKNIEQWLAKDTRFTLHSITGPMRRKCEVVDDAAFVVATDNPQALQDYLQTSGIFTSLSCIGPNITAKVADTLPVTFYTCAPEEYWSTVFRTTGTEAHMAELGNPAVPLHASSEEALYELWNTPYIIPELREGRGEVERYKNGVPRLIEMNDLKGILHNHSTYSDGIHTLREMATYCRDLGYQYLGICDHSRSAVYANGLSIERVREQQREIDQLNQQLAPFRVFKGIESDILGDGSLDYPPEILASFDFVVASIHSNLKMAEDKATERLVKAIENPFTTILGHPTGRLLLVREGYPINYQRVIDACADNGVIIEINANPYRLDIDWRWVEYAMNKGVKLSINPDAHEKAGYHDMYYGVCVARKGGLTPDFTLNAMDIYSVSSHFAQKRSTATVS